ncbi:hypothetical protein ACLOJK_022141 [Asimina triloba]
MLPSPPSKPTSSLSKPIYGECPVGQSKSSIMIAASRSPQICRGRKSTFITAATRGEFASSVANERLPLPHRRQALDQAIQAVCRHRAIPLHHVVHPPPPDCRQRPPPICPDACKVAACYSPTAATLTATTRLHRSVDAIASTNHPSSDPGRPS